MSEKPEAGDENPSFLDTVIAYIGRVIAYAKRRKEIGVFLFILLLFAALFYSYSMSGPSAANHAASKILQDVQRQVAVPEPETLRARVLAVLEDSQEERGHRDLALHLAIALIVAIFIIITVELSTRQELKRETDLYREALGREVWSAITGRMVPPEIGREIEGILKADAVRLNVEYVLTFKRYQELAANFVVLRRDLSYRVMNVTNSTVKWKVRSIIESEFPRMTFRDGDKSGSVPRHISLMIDGENHLRGNPLENVEETIVLPKGKGAEVFVSSEEPARIPGENSYTFLTPGTAFRLTIVSAEVSDLITNLKVLFNHPNRDEITLRVDGSYRYEGGFLPGQGFVVQWKEKRKAGEQPPAH